MTKNGKYWFKLPRDIKTSKLYKIKELLTGVKCDMNILRIFLYTKKLFINISVSSSIHKNIVFLPKNAY